MGEETILNSPQVMLRLVPENGEGAVKVLSVSPAVTKEERRSTALSAPRNGREETETVDCG